MKLFDVLTRLVIDSDIENMSEAQKLIYTPTFLAKTQFRTNLRGATWKGGITRRTEAIQYLLRTFATAYAKCEVI